MKIIQYITKDNVALLFSTISIVITIWKFISSRRKEKPNFSVEIFDSWGAGDGRNILLDLGIINNSYLPVSINRIELGIKYSDGELISRCYGKDDKFKTESVNGIIDKVTYYQKLPLDIPALGSCRGWFQFNSVKVPITKGLNNLECRIILYSKGSIKSFPVSIPKKERVL